MIVFDIQGELLGHLPADAGASGRTGVRHAEIAAGICGVVEVASRETGVPVEQQRPVSPPELGGPQSQRVPRASAGGRSARYAAGYVGDVEGTLQAKHETGRKLPVVSDLKAAEPARLGVGEAARILDGGA